MKRIFEVIVLSLWIAQAIQAAQAAQCSVATTVVAFGVYQPFSSSSNDSTGVVTLTCNGGGSLYSLALSSGGSGSYGTRQMRSSSATLAYQLYLDSTRSTVWGDGTGGSSIVTGSLHHGGTVKQTIYGGIPALQHVVPGSYVDTIIVTVSW